MTIEFLDQWIEALRSGAFTQTRGSLRIVREGKGECFCALGVGMEVVCKNFAIFEKPDRMGYRVGMSSFNDYPPIWPETGFIEDMQDEENISRLVMRLNDTERKTFNEIAIYLDTIVRKQLLDREASRGEKTNNEDRTEIQQALAN